MAVEMKHFLGDMYSILNYYAVIVHLSKNLTTSDISEVGVDFNSLKDIDDGVTKSKIGGKDAVRNIITHRFLEPLQFELPPEYNGTNRMVFPECANTRVISCELIEGIIISYIFCILFLDTVKPYFGDSYKKKDLYTRLFGVLCAVTSMVDTYKQL